MKITLPNGEEILLKPSNSTDELDRKALEVYFYIEEKITDAVLQAYEAGKNSQQPEPTNWLDSVPEKHKKFAQEWDRLGRPEIEGNSFANGVWVDATPDWTSKYYRFAGDPHWELRLKWINSDKQLPIEWYAPHPICGWVLVNKPVWDETQQYREAMCHPSNNDKRK